MGSCDHLRWIGGATGAGKTTVARCLGERFGLAVYDSDAAMRRHAARLDQTTAPLLDRFRRMSMDERWVLRDPATMYQTFPWFHGEGFDLLIEDLRVLPSDRITLVEGFRLLPHLVRPHLWDDRHAVWLIPTPDFRRDAFARRRGAEALWMKTSDPRLAMTKLLQRDQIFAETIAADAKVNRLRTMHITGEQPVEATADAVAARLGLLGDLGHP